MVALLTSLTSARTHAQQPGWAMWGADARNSNTSTHFGVRKVRPFWDIVWTGWNWSGMPSVAPDGTIYFIVNFGFCNGICRGDQRGELRAVSPEDGSIIWSVPLEDSLGRPLVGGHAPMIGPDGDIYLGWLDNEVHDGDDDLFVLLAFDPGGNLLWRFEEIVPLWAPGGEMLAPDGTLYMALGSGFTGGGDEHSSIFAINSATGELNWRFISPNQDDFGLRPALGPDGKLYYAAAEFAPFGYDGFLYRLDPATGEIEWSVNLGQRGANRSLTIGPDGNLYVVDGRCVKYDTEGNILWVYDPTGGNTVRGSAVVWQDRVYVPVCCFAGLGLHVVDALTGELVDILEPGRFIGRDITLDRSGNVYFISDGTMFAYNAAGKLLWQLAVTGGSNERLIIGHDGLILMAPGMWGLSAFGSSVLVGDLNCDGVIDAFDIEPYILILFDPKSYAAAYPDCDGQTAADINVDGRVDAFDIEPFLDLLFP